MVSATIFPILLAVVLHFVDSDLTITISQNGKQVDVNCSVQTLQDTGLSQVATLVLTREQNLVETEVASLVYTGGTTTGSDDLYEAVVTSAIGQNGSTESYLNVHWAELSSDLEGNYSCTLNGTDKDYSSMQISRSIELSFADLWPMFQATPQEIQVGLTNVLVLNCTFGDFWSSDVSEIETIDIFHVHDGLYQLIASVTSLSEAQSKPPGAEGVSVSGSVDTQEPESFLEIKLENPDHEHAGTYICNMLGLTYMDEHVQYNKTVSVLATDPPQASLIARIQELLAAQKGKDEDFQEILQEMNYLNQSLQTVIQENAEFNMTYQELAQEYDNLSFPCAGGPSFTSCDDFHLPVGQHVVALSPFPGHLNYIRVLCHVISAGEVWTIFQKRFDGSVNFTRNYTEYEEGFGSLEGEFWLGLKLLSHLMEGGNNELRVDMTDHNGINYTRIYTTFWLNSSHDYQLTVGGYQDKDYGLNYNSGSTFVTYDHNDVQDCAHRHLGGWWYRDCTNVNLNGYWHGTGFPTGVWWYELTNSNKNTLNKTEMKFRRN